MRLDFYRTDVWLKISVDKREVKTGEWEDVFRVITRGQVKVSIKVESAYKL